MAHQMIWWAIVSGVLAAMLPDDLMSHSRWCLRHPLTGFLHQDGLFWVQLSKNGQMSSFILTQFSYNIQTNVMYYRGITHALYTICRDEGIKGLYKGLGPTLLVSMAYIVYTTIIVWSCHWCFFSSIIIVMSYFYYACLHNELNAGCWT